MEALLLRFLAAACYQASRAHPDDIEATWFRGHGILLEASANGDACCQRMLRPWRQAEAA